MEDLHAAWQAEFSGIRDMLRVQTDWMEDLATGVNARIQALEDGLARLAHAAQSLAKQAGAPGERPHSGRGAKPQLCP
eukprot:5214791-Alexandrium_andersonii.AAC.1